MKVIHDGVTFEVTEEQVDRVNARWSKLRPDEQMSHDEMVRLLLEEAKRGK